MTTAPQKHPVANPENKVQPAVQNDEASLDAAKKIENTKRQQNRANGQDENANLSQDFEAQVKRGVKPIDIEG